MIFVNYSLTFINSIIINLTVGGKLLKNGRETLTIISNIIVLSLLFLFFSSLFNAKHYYLYCLFVFCTYSLSLKKRTLTLFYLTMIEFSGFFTSGQFLNSYCLCFFFFFSISFFLLLPKSSKNTFFFFPSHASLLQCFYFLKAKNKNSSQTCFQNSNFFKIKTVFIKLKIICSS